MLVIKLFAFGYFTLEVTNYCKKRNYYTMIFKIKTNNIRNGLSVIQICIVQSIQLSQLNAGYILMGS